VHRISTSIDIAATAEQVWTVLVDFSAYPVWNPFVRSVSGRTTPGSKLLVTIQPTARRPMTFEPTVLICKPGHEFRWLGNVLVRGVFDGEHSFRLSEHARDSCRFTNEESFSGLLVPFVMRGAMKDATRSGFEAMNQALKRQVERRAA
jgi:hypothetical protein